NGVQQVIDDTEVITQRIGTSVTLGGEMFGVTASTFALGVGDDIRFWLQDSQFDTRLAAWAALRRSGLPYSGTIALGPLADFLDIVFENLQQREKQGKVECKDQDVFDAKGVRFCFGEKL
ncbi:MAG: hypothetical protein H8D34_20480, partial [Chloroflexi bacterium]|nr:hypothetical protein [Chloroflexota bacterium]